jgi:hypothetical protein
VHARSVSVAAIDETSGEVRQARLTPSHDHIRSWLWVSPEIVKDFVMPLPVGQR